jgi:hypothetical protein
MTLAHRRPKYYHQHIAVVHQKRPAMRSTSIKLPKNLEELLERLARARGISRSMVVREALQAYVIDPSRSATAAAGELVGSLDGPRDLSTSPKHLRGFGE